MGKPSQIIAIVEDQRQRNFVLRYLQRLGYSLRAIRFELSPRGQGAAEQWVRQQYPKNVQAYRFRAARAETALIVMIDADRSEVQQRGGQFQEMLTLGGMPTRRAAERIVHLIPKRHIETWILCLAGTEVDEETDYHHHFNIDEQIKPSAEEFFQWSRNNAEIPQHCVDSLRAAIPEVRRLE
jgi:hypothetical protein